MIDQSKSAPRMTLRYIFLGVLVLTLGSVLGFWLSPPDSALAYTLKQVFKVALFLFIPLIAYRFRHIPLKYYVYGLAFCLPPLLSPNYYYLPWIWAFAFSACWLIFYFAAAEICFLYAGMHKNILSYITPILGGIFILLCYFEAWYLATPQNADGIWQDSPGSAYYKGEAIEKAQLEELKSGAFIAPHAASYAHKMLKFDQTLFDTSYTVDEYGHRITPKAREPEYTLMLFGCSYTFGHSLKDDETWAWKLGQDLGPSWQVVNYGCSSFGAQQMYSLLDNNEIRPEPETPQREALFLAIGNHPPRFTGLLKMMRSERFTLKDGQLARNGYTDENPWRMIAFLPDWINGSQAMREFVNVAISAILDQGRDQLRQIYIDLIRDSAKLLKDKYKATLTVLLWPDIEDIAAPLQEAGVKTLLARKFLKNYDANEASFYISPYEWHPNAATASALATGLAAYYRESQ